MEQKIKPLISVIIPAHNNGPVIGDAIRSILDQTYQNLEIIIIDDNSDDDTFEVASEFQKKYINVHCYKLPFVDPRRINKNGRNINAGYSARNYGLEKIKGEWITFQDADDASLRNRIEVQYDLALKYASSHVCIQWMQYRPDLIDKKLDVDRILLEQKNIIVEKEYITKLAKNTKGVAMYLLGNFRKKIPFTIKTARIINKLFFRSLESYPCSGNSPLFKREVTGKVRFRQTDERIWPSFTGRGADRDFNFQVAETFKNSMSFNLPLYLYRAVKQNPDFEDYEKYIIK